MASEHRLIDVNSAVERLKEAEQEMRVVRIVGHKAVSIDAVIQFLEERPTVDTVEVKHGRWREKILVGGFAEEWGFVCSECGCTVSDRSNLGIGRYASNNQRLNYCPNCGAKMDGDGDAK